MVYESLWEPSALTISVVDHRHGSLHQRFGIGFIGHCRGCDGNRRGALRIAHDPTTTTSTDQPLQEFSIEIPDKEADAIQSVDQAVKYILSQPDGEIPSRGGGRGEGGGGLWGRVCVFADLLALPLAAH